MRACFTDEGWDDHRYWVRTDQDILGRTDALIEDARRNLFKGIGKPQPLKGNLAGWWSRRITGDHRLVYAIVGSGDDQRIVIAQCRYHCR